MARSAGRYDGPLRRLVHAFKYEGRRALAAPLGALMRRAGRDILVDADAVVPVPLHPLRALQPGFNQADDLARQLGPVLRSAEWHRASAGRAAGVPAGERP